jgi:hypothetical protein
MGTRITRAKGPDGWAVEALVTLLVSPVAQPTVCLD